VTVSNL